ncbi:NAD(P)-binding domain-containing protein [Nocardia gipuzkoensis]|uniref:NAD(P)-dependent oxidoreductase n=1 Tax=Nocardia gipuzkoensis TaxID=2749991 RepID=UPI001E41481C|nr:NAD(P)-binding domain-containing protein [Nocardia gipuzkoensis]UGT69900.1 NAD(P)-binding domain-containing protein [Nocardia gipuzkoensis]
MNDNRTPVTVLGLGRIGAAIAEIFLRGGHPTTVWNRSAGKDARLGELGATRTASAAEAIAAGRLVVVALADTGAAGGLLGAIPDNLDGRTVLNVATGRPDEARDLAGAIDARGGHFLDAGILGVPQTLGTPDTLLMYSGSPAAHTEHRATIAQLGNAKYLGADAGLAGLHDMAVLAGMYGMFSGFFQAVAMVGSADFTAGEFTDGFLVPWLRSLLDMLPVLAAEIDSQQYPVNFSDLSVNQAGLANIRVTSRDQGVATDLLDPLQRLFDTEVERGNGAASFTRAVAGLLDRAGAGAK